MWVTPKHQDSDFQWPLSLDDKITIFLERTSGWQLDVAERCSVGEKDADGNVLAAPIPHAGFAVLHIVLSYFEMIAKFHQGFVPEVEWDRRSEPYFQEGVLMVLPSLRRESPDLMDEVLEMLYDDARCGLYHSGMTESRIVVGEGLPAAMTFASDERRLWIDPYLLVLAMKDHLADYGRRLRNPGNARLRGNFERRYDYLVR